MSHRPRILALLAPVAVVVAVASAGCGGGDDDAASDRLTQEQFQSRVNKLCTDSGRATQAETRKVLKDKKVLALKRDERNAVVVGRIVDASRPTLGRLRALQPPKAIDADYDTFLSRLDRTYAKLDEVEAAYRKADFDEVSRLNREIQALAKPTQAFAAENGLSDCAPAGGVGSPQS